MVNYGMFETNCREALIPRGNNCIRLRSDPHIALGKKNDFSGTPQKFLPSRRDDGRSQGQVQRPTSICEVCATAKQTREVFTTSKAAQTVIGGALSYAVLCSVLGPVNPAFKSGFKYVVTSIMMRSRCVNVYPLRCGVARILLKAQSWKQVEVAIVGRIVYIFDLFSLNYVLYAFH